jgi:hypothetical protein
LYPSSVHLKDTPWNNAEQSFRTGEVSRHFAEKRLNYKMATLAGSRGTAAAHLFQFLCLETSRLEMAQQFTNL